MAVPPPGPLLLEFPGAMPPLHVGDDPLVLVRGSLLYYHYNCDGTTDAGWGCGYRTAQTILNSLRVAHGLKVWRPRPRPRPSLPLTPAP
jgi:hypothetical protein